MRKLTVAALALVLAASQAAAGRELKTSIEGEMSYVSSYIWRGFDALPDGNDALQPGVTFYLGDSGHSFNLWGSTGVDKTGDLDEVDLTWNYTRAWSGRDDAALSFGLVYYGYPQADSDSVEIYTGVTLTNMLLQPSLMVFADFGEGDGYYATLGVNHTFGAAILGKPVNFTASAGYQDGYWGAEPGVSDITFSLSTDYEVGTVRVTPALNFAVIPEDSVNADDNEFWFSITGTTEIRHRN